MTPTAAINVGPTIKAVIEDFPGLGLFPDMVGRGCAVYAMRATAEGASVLQIAAGLSDEAGRRIVAALTWSLIAGREMGCV